ncbi:hypothetical protein ES703_38246 [subsurface metagenome]
MLKMQKLVDIDLVKFASHQGKRIHILEKNGILILPVLTVNSAVLRLDLFTLLTHYKKRE